MTFFWKALSFAQPAVVQSKIQRPSEIPIVGPAPAGSGSGAALARRCAFGAVADREAAARLAAAVACTVTSSETATGRQPSAITVTDTRTLVPSAGGFA